MKIGSVLGWPGLGLAMRRPLFGPRRTHQIFKFRPFGEMRFRLLRAIEAGLQTECPPPNLSPLRICEVRNTFKSA
jgi:hypothetical protein